MGKEWEYKWNKIYLPPNTLLNKKYRISAVLGKGNFGITYLGYDVILEHNVAIKEFFPCNIASRSQSGKGVVTLEKYADIFEKEKKEFKEEAERIFGLFDIPGICIIKDYFEENETAYIVEEYLSGGTLKEYLEEQSGHSISWEECKQIFEPVMKGLCHIHAMGVVHRDISPDNLMFTEEGELKLIDFGAAKSIKSTDDGIKLKEFYAPPELYKSEEMIGPWSDIYSLCCVMYQALTGRKPVPAYQRIQKDTLVSTSAYINISQEAEAAIHQGLSLDIPQRYFYLGNFINKLGMDVSEVQGLTGQSRALWGELWLKIITENSTQLQKARKKKLTYKQKKQMLAVFVCTLLMLGFAMGGLKIYANTHQHEVLQYKAQKMREELGTSLEHPFILTDLDNPEEFEKMRTLLAPYEVERASAREGYYRYEVPVSVIKELGLRSNGYIEYGKFYVDIQFTEELLRFCYGQDIEISDETYSGAVSIRPMAGHNELTSSAYCAKTYTAKNKEGEKVTLSVTYDPADDIVSRISVDGSIDDGKFFVENIFPYYVTETYLTKEDVENLFAESEAAMKETMMGEEYLSVDTFADKHARFSLNVHTMVGATFKTTRVELKRNGYNW